MRFPYYKNRIVYRRHYFFAVCLKSVYYVYIQLLLKKSKIYNALCHIFSSFAYFCRRSNTKIKYQTEPWSHTFCFFSLLVPFVHSSSLSHVYFVCIYIRTFFLTFHEKPACCRASLLLSNWMCFLSSLLFSSCLYKRRYCCA